MVTAVARGTCAHNRTAENPLSYYEDKYAPVKDRGQDEFPASCKARVRGMLRTMLTLNNLLRWTQIHRLADVIVRPKALFAQLRESRDVRLAWSVLIISAVFFSATTLIAHFRGVPFSAPPLWDDPRYRLLQAVGMPVVLGLGWWIFAYLAWMFNVLLRGRGDFRQLLAVSAPALFVPLWLVMLPTDLALSWGLLQQEASGFPGLWVRHLTPAFTFLYTLAMLWLACWQVCRLLLREAFAVAMLALLPVLALWSLLLR